MMTDVILVPPPVQSIEITPPAAPAVVVQPLGAQGPPGPPDENSFKVPARFAELLNEPARAEARSNLGVETIDLGTFN